MSKRILLLAGNYAPEPTGIGKYNGELIEWLAATGFDCKVITTYPYYPHWKVDAKYNNKQWWFTNEVQYVQTERGTRQPLYITRCPHYIPQKPTGLRRMIADFSFFISSFFALLPLFFTKKYDYVLAVAPPFQLGILGWLYKSLKGGEFLYHIQDLQVDAAAELGMIRSKWLLRLLFKTEKFILNRATFISTISTGMVRKVEAKCNRRVALFANWTDTKHFFPVKNMGAIKEFHGFDAGDVIVLYSGAMGEKQGLEGILAAAESLAFIHHVKFVICGSGPYQRKLVEKQQQMGLHNVIFMSLQPKESFNDFLNMADVHLVLQKGNASDLVMPSKLTTILATGGLSIVTASPGTSLYDLMKDEEMGLVIAPENTEALVNAITHVIAHDLEYMRENAFAYAQKNFCINQTLSRYFNELSSEKTPATMPFIEPVRFKRWWKFQKNLKDASN